MRLSSKNMGRFGPGLVLGLVLGVGRFSPIFLLDNIYIGFGTSYNTDKL